MKKVYSVIAGLVFKAFGMGIIGLVMTLTYQALQHIFPNDPQKQMWGMVVFDVAVIAWALGFAFRSKSVQQYGAAGAGFLLALVGTIGMIAAEVIIGGQELIPAQRQQIGQWMVYGFIALSALHVILLWIHHAGAPDMHAQIDLGAARAQVLDSARNSAVHKLEVETAALADTLSQEILEGIKRDLNLPIPPPYGSLFNPPTTYQQTTDQIDWAAVNAQLEAIKQDMLAAKSTLLSLPTPPAPPVIKPYTWEDVKNWFKKKDKAPQPKNPFPSP